MRTKQIIARIDEERGRARPFRVRLTCGGRKVPGGPAAFASRADAEAFVRQFAAEQPVEMETPAAKDTWPPHTVGAIFTRWLASVKVHKQPATHDLYEREARLHILPVFGRTMAKNVAPDLLTTFFDGLIERQTGLGTREHVWATLSAALSWAALQKLIPANPLRVQRKKVWVCGPNERLATSKANPLAEEQAQAFLDYAKTHERRWYPYLLFLHDTGVRPGEATALKWRVVRLERHEADIVASFCTRSHKDKATKTGEERTIELSDLLVEALSAWRKEQTKHTLAAGRTRREYVFTNTRGSRVRQDSDVTAAFARICGAVGLVDEDGKPRHSLYDLRSTFATIHIMAGRVAFAQHQLGHKHQQTTTTHYFKWLPTERTKGFSNLIRKAK